MDVSVGSGVSVVVGGSRVKVGCVVTSCEGDTGPGAVGSVQAVNKRTNAYETFMYFDFIS